MAGFIAGRNGRFRAIMQDGRNRRGAEFGGGGDAGAAMGELEHFAIDSAGMPPAIMPHGAGDETGGGRHVATEFAQEDVCLIVGIDRLTPRPHHLLGNLFEYHMRRRPNLAVYARQLLLNLLSACDKARANLLQQRFIARRELVTNFGQRKTGALQEQNPVQPRQLRPSIKAVAAMGLDRAGCRRPSSAYSRSAFIVTPLNRANSPMLSHGEASMARLYSRPQGQSQAVS